MKPTREDKDSAGISGVDRTQTAGKEDIATLQQRLAEGNADLQAVLDIAPVAIWIAHDPQCRQITGNRYADELVMHVLRGANISASATPSEAAVTYRVLRKGVTVKPEELPAQRAAATGKSVAAEMLELVFSDGRVIHLFMGAVPLFDAAGRVRGAVAAGADVTLCKQAEERMRQDAAKLQDQNEVLTRFNRVAVDRELRMIELKREVNELCAQAGQKSRYPLEFEQEKGHSSLAVVPG